ncbi:hypothetical protein [uncultured Lamprocystis sp.]|jgi:hypothetical protein|uniref:hypothetical protein n=1 Tax=uncultured Lamprocystis sp. TaxID=543132 RepID=UPI0025E9CA72|nr:hypothetical protein [uncultured Lamprocystis sp.]
MIKRLTNTPWQGPFCAATALCCAALSLPAHGMVGNQYEFLFSAKPGKTVGQT